MTLFSLLKLFSRLPLPVLYLFSDVLSLFIWYRRKTVRENLRLAFPHQSPAERRRLERAFYRRFCDLLAEGVKGVSISEPELRRRFVIENPELAEDYFHQGKSILLTGGHIHNWELLILAQNLMLSHQAVGIGKPLKNKGFGFEMNAARARTGMWIVSHKDVREKLAAWHAAGEKMAVLMLADQSPNSIEKCHWTTLFGIPTPAVFGPEYFAKKYGFPVLFFTLTRPKRGHYRMHLSLSTDTPQATSTGEITEAYNRRLEQAILNDPVAWTWSHRRWKHKDKFPGQSQPEVISKKPE